MFGNKMKFAVCGLGLIGGVVFIQHHAIEFWREILDSQVMGAWASVMLEVVAMSFFFRKGWSNKALGLLVTAVLLSGPLHEVGKPVYDELFDRGETLAAAEAELVTLDERLAVTRKNLETRQENSANPDLAGWAKYVESSTEKLDRLQARKAGLAAKVESLASRETGWHSYVAYIPTGLYALALTLVQFFNATMVTTMGNLARAEEARKSHKSRAEEPAESPASAPSLRVVRKKQRDGSRLGVALQGEGLQGAIA